MKRPDCRSFCVRCPALLAACGLMAATAAVAAAQTETAAAPEMRSHYDAAYRLQAAGDVEGADREHTLFLAEALHHVANTRANIGDYSRAEPIYQDALQLVPGDADVQFDYAKAAMDAEDPEKAERLARELLDQMPQLRGGKKSSVMRVEAEALRSLGQHQKALDEFKAAVDLDPSFENTYALANAYLWVGDKADGTRVFAEMESRFSDTAVLHMDLGRGYAEANYFADAIAEYRKAIVLNARMPGVHYSLGACYLSLSGKAGYAQAEPEFRKELEIQPNDPFSFPQLGKIALDRRDYVQAGVDLERAVALNPRNSDNYLLLAQLYAETNRMDDSIAALRRAVALTPDPSRNHYAIHAAHYQLGRLLIQRGEIAAGKQEMKIAEDLLARSDRQDESTLNGKPQVQLPLETTRVASAGEKAEDVAYEKSVSPLIAASYNNLGVHAAMKGEYAAAAAWFAHASQWDPLLAGVSGNWGRAAFAAHEYADAVAPLLTALRSHPDDRDSRIALGVSQYETGDYKGAMQTLTPIASTFAADTSLAAVYAECRAKAAAAGTIHPTGVENSSPQTTNKR